MPAIDDTIRPDRDAAPDVEALVIDRPDARLHGVAIGTGPPVLLLHAGRERRQVWNPVIGPLCAAGHRCIAIDQRDHGASTRGCADSLPPFASDVAAMLSLAPGALLVGASLGGLAALLALAVSGTRALASGLVLVDVVPDPDPDRARSYLAPIVGSGAPLVEDVLSRAAQLRDAATVLDLPALLVRGGRSLLTDDDVERFLTLVPHASVAVVPDAGHLVAKDDPAALAAALLDHLGSA